MTSRSLAIGWSSQPSSRSSVLAVLGLLVAVSGCTTADRQRNGEASTGAVRDSAPPSVVMQPEEGDHLWVFAETKYSGPKVR